MPHTLLLRLPAPGQEDTEWLSIDETGVPSRREAARPLEPGGCGGALGARSWRSRRRRRFSWPSPNCLRAAASSWRARCRSRSRSSSPRMSISCASRSGGACRAAARPSRWSSRSVLQGWLAQLTAAGIEPPRSMPTSPWCRRIRGRPCCGWKGTRLAVRRPGMLPFAVELTPVAEALVVAGVIPDPLEPTERSPRPLESAVLYVDPRGLGTSAGRVRGAGGSVRIAQGADAPEGPLPWLARRSRRHRCGQSAARRIRPHPPTTARAGADGARPRCWRAALLAAHVAAAALADPQANHETTALDSEIAQVFSQSDAHRDDAGSAPPDAVASRPHSPLRTGPGILSAHARGPERRDVRHAEDQHRCAQLSRASARHEGDGTESRRALAAVSAGGQAGA